MPGRPPGSASRASPPAQRTRPGAARDRDRAVLRGWGMCVQDPGLVLTFGPAGSREAPRGWDSQQRPVLMQRLGKGLCPRGLEDVGRRALFSPSSRFGFCGGRRGSAEKAKRIFCCPLGVRAGLCGVRETCNGPGTRASCHLVTSRLLRPLAPEVPGFVCSNECPGMVSPRGGAAPPALGPLSPRCSSLLAGEDSICRGSVPL